MNEKECRELYREAFKDPDTEFEDRLFSLCGEYCRTLTLNGKAVSMLFALPCEIYSEGKILNGFYIYAAATAREHRGKGYMSRLINSLKCGGVLLFLKPAYSGLVGFYERLGFKPFTASGNMLNDCRALPKDGFLVLSDTEKSENTGSYTAMYYGDGEKRLDGMYFPYTMD